jgi:2-hydroxychromene-2-carboxylate isomerase
VVLVLYFDYASAASAVAVLRLQALADQGAQVGFAGIDVLGLDVSLPVTLDQLAELERWAPRARSLGLELRRPRVRPATLGAHLVGTLAETHDLGAAWRLAALEAYWTRGVDLGDDDRLIELATTVGLPSEEVRDWLADHSRRAAMRRTMTADRGRGIGGVPVLEFQGTFVGADLGDEDLRRLAEL